MNYEDETRRRRLYQEDIEFEKVWEWQDLIIQMTTGEPCRLVDNRKAYIKKRMALEELK
jgi:hypothetical protein